MDRRHFLAGAGSVAVGALVPNVKLARAATSGLSILQGLTTETTTQLSVDIGKDIGVVYSLTDVATSRVVAPLSVLGTTFGSSGTRVDKVKFENLELGHTYHLVVRETKKNQILDDRYLSTVDLNKPNAKIALMSCMNDSMSARTKIWASAQATDFDYAFFIGDSVYGDFLFMHGPAYLWDRYVQSREKIPFYHWKNLKPVIGIWDDHDFGKNNEGGNYKYKNHAYHIFKTFFAQEPDGRALVNGWANSVFFEAFGQNFAFFDSRYYRGLPNPDGTTGFIGHEQLNWMTDRVRSRRKPTWVIQGSPIFGRFNKGGSYQAVAPQELEFALAKIKSWDTPVIFAAGDLHYTEISSIDKNLLGYETYELISSSMHSNTKSKFHDNPNPQLHGYLKENFLLLEQTGNVGDPSWNVTCIAKDLQVPFDGKLKVG